MNKHLFLFTAFTALPLAGTRAAVTETFNFNGLNLAVPDGNPSGLANLQTLNSTIATIDSVLINLTVSGSFNGDLYAYVTHGSGFSVLLNRSGKSAGNAFGYNDDGFSVTFDDTALGDIHTYRDTVMPTAGNPLTGTWQPDGRNVDPDGVTNLTLRTAMLGSFAAGNANGDWTLFVADLSGGDSHILESWSVTVTGTVPEPSVALLAATGILAAATRRRRK